MEGSTYLCSFCGKRKKLKVKCEFCGFEMIDSTTFYICSFCGRRKASKGKCEHCGYVKPVVKKKAPERKVRIERALAEKGLTEKERIALYKRRKEIYLDECEVNIRRIRVGEPPLLLSENCRRFTGMTDRELRALTPLHHREILRNYMALFYDGRELYTSLNKEFLYGEFPVNFIRQGILPRSEVDYIDLRIPRSVYMEHLPADITARRAQILSFSSVGRLGKGVTPPKIWPISPIDEYGQKVVLLNQTVKIVSIEVIDPVGDERQEEVEPGLINENVKIVSIEVVEPIDFGRQEEVEPEFIDVVGIDTINTGEEERVGIAINEGERMNEGEGMNEGEILNPINTERREEEVVGDELVEDPVDIAVWLNYLNDFE